MRKEDLPRLPGYVTMPEAAEILGITRQGVSMALKRGVFKSALRVGSTVVIAEREVRLRASEHLRIEAGNLQ